MKLLAVGDIHLGRRPTRLPEELASRAWEFSPAAAWGLSVDFALKAQVDAVLLAGDVVESEKDFFEAFRQLRTGIDRLTDAGVRVFAVAGNHDVLVLPRLADLLEGDSNFKLLGRDGKWEFEVIEASGERLTLWGWSFPRSEVGYSPVASASFKGGSGVQLGLLHCDLDHSGGSYAPVRRSELQQAPLDGWLLGHIHVPHRLSPDSLCGYLGCLSGMDPGEPGARGPWLLQIAEGRVCEVAHIPLAPIRWERVPIDVSELKEPGDIVQLIHEAASQLDQTLSRESHSPKAVGMRVTLVGQTDFSAELSDWAQSSSNEPSFPLGSREYFVEHCDLAVLRKIDLEKCAKQSDPLGLLAHRLLLLDRPREDPERIALLRTATNRFRDSLDEPIWQGLESNGSALEEEQVVARLRLAGTSALNKLYAQELESLS